MEADQDPASSNAHGTQIDLMLAQVTLLLGPGSTVGPALVNVDEAHDATAPRVMIEIGPDLRLPYELHDENGLMPIGGMEDLFAMRIVSDALKAQTFVRQLMERRATLILEAAAIIAEEGRRGCEIRLIDIQPAPFQEWLQAGDPILRCEFEGLGHHLRPSRFCYGIAGNDVLVARMARELDLQRILVDRRRELAAFGADGVTDELTIAIIASSGRTVGNVLSSVVHHSSLELTNALRLHWHKGRLFAHADLGQMEIRGRHLTLKMVELPSTALAACIGRPMDDVCASDLIRMPWLITEVIEAADDDVPAQVAFGLDVPDTYLAAGEAIGSR